MHIHTYVEGEKEGERAKKKYARVPLGNTLFIFFESQLETGTLRMHISITPMLNPKLGF